jgi:outer membrane protein assembly factor BamB
MLLMQMSVFAQSNRFNAPAIPLADGELLWNYDSDYSFLTDPATDENGKVYFVGYNTSGISRSTLYCINSTGDLLWSKEFIYESIQTNPTIIPQTGEIILGSVTYGTLYCLNPDGNVNWTYDAGESITQPVAIDTCGNIYIASESKLTALTIDGTFRWEYFSQHGNITSPISVNRYGNIYFGTEFNKLICLKNLGTEVFSSDLYGFVRGEPTIDIDGTIYMTSCSYNMNKSKIEAFQPDGSKTWEMIFNEVHPTAAIIGDSNFIYIRTGGGDGRLYKIDKLTHSVAWSYYFSGTSGCASTPTVASDGTVYFSTVGSSNGAIYAINPNGSVKWQFCPYNNGLDCSPLGSVFIGTNGKLFTTVYSMNYDGSFLIALADQGAAPADSPWPVLRHDNCFTGLAENIVSPRPNIFYYPSKIDFGYIEQGETAMDTLVIKNTGQVYMMIDWALESDVFAVEAIVDKKQIRNTQEIVIPSNDSLLMIISFTSAGYGIFDDSLIIATNDPDQLYVPIGLRGKSILEGEIKWRLQLPDITNGPAIDDYGTIYLSGTDTAWAIYPDGRIKWKYIFNSPLSECSADNITISNDNSMLFIPKESRIFSCDSAGNKRWIINPPGNHFITALACSKTNSIYFGDLYYTGYGYLYCYDYNGSMQWKYPTFNNLFEPVIDNCDNIIIASQYSPVGTIYSLTDSGSLNWNNDFYPDNAASIGKKDQIYVGGRFGYDSYCIALYANNGELIWSFGLLNEYDQVTTEIVTGTNNELYIGTSNFSRDYGYIIATNTDGQLLWTKILDTPVRSTPAIAHNGNIYFGCDNGNFYALNPDGSERWVISTGASITTSPAIDTAGIVYFTNEDHYVYAVYGVNGGLADTPWPMKQHDTKHSSAADSTTYTGIKDHHAASGIILFPNKPNPISNVTVFSFYLPEDMQVRCFITDMKGNKCYDWEPVIRTKGRHEIIWNKQHKDSKSIKPGIYLFTLATENEYLSQKILVN